MGYKPGNTKLELISLVLTDVARVVKEVTLEDIPSIVEMANRSFHRQSAYAQLVLAMINDRAEREADESGHYHQLKEAAVSCMRLCSPDESDINLEYSLGQPPATR